MKRSLDIYEQLFIDKKAVKTALYFYLAFAMLMGIFM